MPIPNKTEWYGVNAAVVRKTDNITVYSIACDTPNGKMKVFHLFPGINYAETSFKTALCDYRKQTAAEVVEIAYCKAGRFECEYQSGYFTYIGEGDCAVGILEAQTETPYFPLDYYTGCAVIIDLNITGTFFRTAVEGISINLNALLQNFVRAAAVQYLKRLMYCAAYLRIYMRFPAIPIIPRIKHSAIYG